VGAGHPEADDQTYVGPNLHSSIVNQAAGMVSVQANCLIQEAFVLMDARAELADDTLDEIAEAVLDRSIHFG
jgi:hypothetical protein